MKPLRFALAVLACHAVLAQAGGTEVTVDNAWVRQPPPGARTGAAFLTLHNAGKTEVRLVSASNPASALTELHTHLHENGVMKMRQVKEIAIPAGGETRLEPGGYHVMLIDLKQALKAGDTLPLTLRFADGSHQELAVPVRLDRPAPSAASSTMDHANHMPH